MINYESRRYNNDDKKYKDDTCFQLINKKFLTLDENHRKINNEHLQLIVEKLFIPRMKEDELFNTLYQKIVYSGSYYKGTKISKPDEYDLDFVLNLPIDYSRIKVDTDHDNYGFVKLKVDKTGVTRPKWERHRKILDSWITSDNYLNQDKFNRWMQAIFEESFRKLSGALTSCYNVTVDERNYKLRYSKSGPAFTVIVITPEYSEISIDMVPCFEFNHELGNGYKRSKGFRRSWMVVSKPLPYSPDGTILWRLCFYEQEKELLQGDVKPVIRMMKKFRDSMDWKSLASYYIETIFYHELEAHQQNISTYLTSSKTWLFMKALRRLKEACEQHRLTYYWHPSYNLFEKIGINELNIYANTLQKIINRIDKNIEQNRYILAQEVLTPVEYADFHISFIEPKVIYLDAPLYEERRTPKVEHNDSWCTIV